MTTLTIRGSMTTHHARLGPWLIWGLFALALVFAPQAFDQGASVSLLSQMGTMMIFALSYNMLFGQGGMLSFGHAVYSGLGAYCAVHAMNLASAGEIWLPLVLVPFVGGLAGMFFGALFGYVTTRKAGTTFAMITLGIAELVFASSLMFPEFFGGEGGISTNRVYGPTFLGFGFGPQIQVYYLIATWLLICTVGMYAFTQTPLGRIINAVRDNPERAEFIGYDTQWARYLTLIVSGFFAGIAGALTAINFEIVTAENLAIASSGYVLLFTFIGGAGYFFGPLIGAVVGVLLTVSMASLTPAWHLYLGVFFIVIVMYAPGGIASVLASHARVVRHGLYGRLLGSVVLLCACAVLALAGVVMAVEMLYFRKSSAEGETAMQFLGVLLDVGAASTWLGAAGMALVGSVGFAVAKRRFNLRWTDAHARIEKLAQRSEA